jgi:hypothetical protein
LATTDSDPRAAKRQRGSIAPTEFDKERDWVGLLGGLGLAIGGVFFVIGCIHLYLAVTG